MNGIVQHTQAERAARFEWSDESRPAMVVFDSENRANEGLRALRELYRDRRLTLGADAVIVKDEQGSVSVHRSRGDGPQATMLGLLLGSLVGVLAGWFGLLVGASVGTLIGAAVDLSWVGIGEESIAGASALLAPGEAAVVAELGPEFMAGLYAAMEALNGRVVRKGHRPSATRFRAMPTKGTRQ